MNSIRMKELQAIEELMKEMQGKKLKASLDAMKKPVPEEMDMDKDHGSYKEEMPDGEMKMEKKPHGIEIEKTEIMGKPKEEEMSDDELQELISKYL